MKDQLNTPKTENNSANKKTWQTPSIEIISRDNVQSGSAAGGAEGQPTAHSILAYSS